MLDLKSTIRDIADFPKKGIIFKDITPLLKSPTALTETAKALAEQAKGLKIRKIAAIESRGFIFGALLSERLGAGFVPIRKKGKLPAAVYQESYELEYGTDILEMHQDAIEKGEKVLIHDDVLATGGTAQAACRLVEKAGGEIVLVSFLIELSFLNGRDLLANYPVKSLIQY
jgi:adenine phosphoribosyltransferase